MLYNFNISLYWVKKWISTKKSKKNKNIDGEESRGEWGGF